MLALLRTRRWIGFTALVVVSIIGFGLLSQWQWSRAEEERQERIAIEQGEVVAGESSEISNMSEFSRVKISGEYIAEDTVLLRQRPLDGGNGYWVLTPLRTTANAAGADTGALDTGIVWVVRGWLGASTQALDVPPIPAAPQGPVSVEGAVRLFENARDNVSGLPERVVSRMSVEELSFAGTAQNRVLQLASSNPEESIIPVPLPDIDEGQNISYAVQWILFALVAMGGWFIFLRREAQEQQPDQERPISVN